MPSNIGGDNLSDDYGWEPTMKPTDPTPDLPTATDLPKRMSEERLTELRGFACITYVAELFDHIDALTAENADLRRSLDVAETAFRVAEKIATASNNERDAARAECERLREELATTQRLYITAQDDIVYEPWHDD